MKSAWRLVTKLRARGHDQDYGEAGDSQIVLGASWWIAVGAARKGGPYRDLLVRVKRSVSTR